MTLRALCAIAAPLVAACAPPGDAPPDGGVGDSAAPWFADEAGARGIDFEHRSGFAGRPLLPQIVGGGAALADLDGDGDLDAYLVQSGWALGGGIDVRGDAPRNRLYRNLGGGRFAHWPGADDDGYGMGVAAGDYDGDGDIDLYVTNFGRNALLRNDGAGGFKDVAAAAGVDDPGWGTAAAFVDLDVDGDLDLFLVNYMHWSLPQEKDCLSRGEPTYCSPTTYAAPAADRLLRNDGDGTFTDVTAAAGIDRAYGNGLGIAAADFDGDGLTDIFVANDKMVNQLWLNLGGLAFDEAAAAWGCAMDEHGVAKAGMGVGAADVDDDGDADLLVVNLKGETDSFFRNEGGYFVDATARAGLGAGSRRYTRFGVALADFDNDGRLDLYEANGSVDGRAGMPTDAFAEPNVLYRGVGGDVGAPRFAVSQPPGGVAAPLVHTSRAVAVGDVDDDGGLDLLVVNRDAPAYLLMNRARRGNWARFRVLTAGGADAHGAKVFARIGGARLRRDVQVAASYLAANDPRVHFGMGGETVAGDVTVHWPGGAAESFGDFPAGATVELRRGAGKPASERMESR